MTRLKPSLSAKLGEFRFCPSVENNLFNPTFNPYHVEFLKWNNPPNIFGTFHYHI